MDNSVKVIAVQPCCEAQAEGQSERTATGDETHNGKARLTSKGSKLPLEERARDHTATIADNVDEEAGVASKVRTYASAGVKRAGKVANIPCKIEPSNTTVMDNSTTATAGIVVEHDGCGVYVADQSHEREAREIDATSHEFVDPGRAEVTSTVVGALIIEATSNEAVEVETALSEIVIGRGHHEGNVDAADTSDEQEARGGGCGWTEKCLQYSGRAVSTAFLSTR